MILHKPRGCKGVWHSVQNSDALRVTRGKGKWLKVKLESRFFFSKDVDLYLVDLISNPSGKLEHSQEPGYLVESISDVVDDSKGGYFVEIELKLDRICKKLQFVALFSLVGPNQQIIGNQRAHSIIFGTHNNGKAGSKTQEEPETTSTTQPQPQPQPTASVSSSSSPAEVSTDSSSMDRN